MPVWHALSKTWRDQYDLAVVGIAQEQHPERCELYARWQGFDWPILWDPFNLTGADAVPGVFLLDETGVVLAVGPRPEEVEALLARPAPPGARSADDNAPGAGAAGGDRAADTAEGDRADDTDDTAEGDRAADTDDTVERAAWRALSQLLFEPRPAADAVDVLTRWADAHPDDPAARFRAGVALRLRHDSPSHRTGDFQAALDAWSAALAARPEAYIWRRRIQQYGPTLDKPYPFYPWIDEARAALVARGETAPDLGTALTEAERAAPARSLAAADDEPAGDGPPEPAPWQRDLPDDSAGLVSVETAVAAHTRDGGQVVRVHLLLRPDPFRAVHWDDEPGAPEAWLSVPEGWSLARRRHVLPPADDASGPRRLDFEVGLPDGARGHLDVTLAYSVCRDLDGVCASFRRQLQVPLPAP